MNNEMDYKNIEIESGTAFDQVKKMLLQANSRGEKISCIYNGKKFYSTDTIEEMYQKLHNEMSKEDIKELINLRAKEEKNTIEYMKQMGVDVTERYKRVELNPNLNLVDVVKILLNANARGEDISCVFHGVELYSIYNNAEMYYKEFEMSEYTSDYEKESQKAIVNIPNWIERGKKIIDPGLYEKWEKCVNIRVKDGFHGSDLEDALNVMEALSNGKSLEEAYSIFNKNSYSPSGYNMVLSIIATFSPKGKEFIDYINKELEYKSVEIIPDLKFDDVVKMLLDANARGEKISYEFNRKKLYSTYTEDEMYQTVFGMSKEEVLKYRSQFEKETEEEMQQLGINDDVVDEDTPKHM